MWPIMSTLEANHAACSCVTSCYIIYPWRTGAEPRSEAPAGLSGAGSGRSSPAAGRRAIGFPARPSSSGSSAPRGSPSAAPFGTCSAPGLVERRAGSGTYVKAARGAGGAVVRPPDPRPRRDRDLRADLPGHDGVAARARARARVGQPQRRRRRRRRTAPGSCAGNTSTGGSPASSSRPSSSRRRRTTSTSGSRRPSTRRTSRSSCSTGPCSPIRERGHHDLVGIDNRRAGYVITEHLLRLGARRIAFVGVGNAAATVDAREAGYREALLRVERACDRARAGAPPRSGGRAERPGPHGVRAPGRRSSARTTRRRPV